MGKYDPLRDYLAGCVGDEVKLSFGDIERLVGNLPASARHYRAWWANDSKVEARAWRSAGWRVRSVNQDAQVVVFARSSGDRTWADGEPTATRRAEAAASALNDEPRLGHDRSEEQAPPLLPEGLVFAERYRVKRRLGYGERKQTYLAWDIKGKREVALAIVANGADPHITEREVEILGQVVGGSNIVRFIDWDLAKDEQFLVFEYLSGGDLRNRCREWHKQGIQIPLPEFFRLARQLCRALSHIHQHGIIHRDVSTSNIWLNERGDAHLGDFDTATSPQHPSLEEHEFSTYEAFPAPELRSGADIDARADIYSLGAVLYEVLTGTPPLLTDDPLTPIAPPSQARNDLPAGLDRLIISMLAPDRDERPDSASDLARVFRKIEGRASELQSLIANGESGSVEFKSSLRTDVPGGGLNKALEHVAVKSIVGFLNGNGGTLLIGVADDRSIVGLGSDYRSSSKIGGRDGFERKLRELLSASSGRSVQAFVTVTFHDVAGHDICRVSVEPSDRPVYAKEEGKTKFYLRTGNSTNELAVDDAIKYYTTRWR